MQRHATHPFGAGCNLIVAKVRKGRLAVLEGASDGPLDERRVHRIVHLLPFKDEIASAEDVLDTLGAVEQGSTLQRRLNVLARSQGRVLPERVASREAVVRWIEGLKTVAVVVKAGTAGLDGSAAVASLLWMSLVGRVGGRAAAALWVRMALQALAIQIRFWCETQIASMPLTRQGCQPDFLGNSCRQRYRGRGCMSAGSGTGRNESCSSRVV